MSIKKLAKHQIGERRELPGFVVRGRLVSDERNQTISASERWEAENFFIILGSHDILEASVAAPLFQIVPQQTSQ